MTLHAVEGVFRQTRHPDHVYVVDNGSGDGSDDRLREGLARYGDRATLIVNPGNRGFGGGCNPAIAAALAAGHAYIWLLNNDAEPEPECLAALLTVATDAPGRVGAVGSLLIDPTGRDAPHFGSWMRPAALTCGSVDSAADLSRPYAWCTAASLLLDAGALAQVGRFDECFFMYWEDADLNLRLRDAGYAILCAPDARVLHDAGTSSAAIPVQRYLWHFDSQRRFLSKHHRYPRAARLWLRGKFLLKAIYDRDAKRFNSLLAQS
jgi:GT2 family glycosyltransferase